MLSSPRRFLMRFRLAVITSLCYNQLVSLGAGIRRQQQNIDTTISNTAAYVASLEGVTQMLDRGYPDPAVKRQLDQIHQHYQDIDTITVYDRSGLRFYHTSRLDTGDTLPPSASLLLSFSWAGPSWPTPPPCASSPSPLPSYPD